MGNMTLTERREIKGIIKRRFGVLRKDIEVRERELQNVIRDNIREKHEAELKRIDKELAALQTTIVTALSKSKMIRDQARNRGIDVQFQTNSEGAYYRVAVANLEDKVRDEFRQLWAERGRADLSIDQQEVDLLERLALESIESDDAKSFLSTIPTLDAILPPPSTIKSLNS